MSTLYIPATLSCNGLALLWAVVAKKTMTATLVDISELNREISRLQAAMIELQLKRTTLQSLSLEYAQIQGFSIRHSLTGRSALA